MISPVAQAEMFLDQRQRAMTYRNGASLMQISKAIAHDPLRLAGAIRNASGEHMADLCCALIQTHSPDFDGDVTALVEALSLICNDAAKDES